MITLSLPAWSIKLKAAQFAMEKIRQMKASKAAAAKPALSKSSSTTRSASSSHSFASSSSSSNKKQFGYQKSPERVKAGKHAVCNTCCWHTNLLLFFFTCSWMSCRYHNAVYALYLYCLCERCSNTRGLSDWSTVPRDANLSPPVAASKRASKPSYYNYSSKFVRCNHGQLL